MSRNSKRKRNKRSKKRHGRPKTVTDAPRTSTKRKRCRSNKKRLRKLKRVKFDCTVCMSTSHGIRRFLDCGHVFHRKCVNPWLKNHTSKCPICRKDIPINTGRHQLSNPEIRPDSSANLTSSILHTMTRELLSDRELLRPIQNLGNLSSDLGVPSSNSDNLNMDLDDPSLNLDNSSIDLDDPFPDLRNVTIDSDNRSSHMDHSSIDSVDSLLNFDISSTDTPYPSPNLDILAREFPRPSRNLNNPSVELPRPSRNLNNPSVELPRPSRILNNPSVELPILFVPVLCSRCPLDSNVELEQGGFDSNENRSRRILWDDEQLHRQISILRILLEDRDFTFNVLNSPAELDRDLILNCRRR